MDITKDKELASAYRNEASELLRIMREAAAGLQLGRGKRVFYRLFRCAHTLKEISGCMGLKDIEKNADELLEISKVIKNDREKLDDSNLSLIYKKMETCEELVRRYLK